MRKSLILLVIPAIAGCGPKPYVGTGPSTVHDKLSFRATSTKLEFQDGEQVRLAGYLKNEDKRYRYVLTDQDPRMGVTHSITLTGPGGKYEPELEPLKPRDELALDNSSFIILDPGKESRVSLFEIRSAVGPDAKSAALAPGDYTAKIRYEVRLDAGEKTAEGTAIPHLGDASSFLAKSPRAVWEAEVTFKISTEPFKPPARRSRGGGPSGG